MNQKILTVSPKQRTALFVTQAEKNHENLLSDNSTFFTSRKAMEVSWNVNVAESGLYYIEICASVQSGTLRAKVCCGPKETEMDMDKTHGYFRNPEKNFAKYYAAAPLYLEAGSRRIHFVTENREGVLFSVSALNLYPAAQTEKFKDTEHRAQLARSSTEKYGSGFGLMFHWTGESQPEAGERIAYEEAVNRFDTEAFADMVSSTHASYVLFTANHAIEHFPAPLSSWEKYFGKTTSRDLIADLYESLHRRNIDLMLYLNFTCAYVNSPLSGVKKTGDDIADYLEVDSSHAGEFERIAVDIFREIGDRYGDKIKGYWVDSCYCLEQQFGTLDFESMFRAAKTGYPDRLVTFNYWILPVLTPWVDYWAGETVEILTPPDKKVPDYGPAAGIPFQDLIILDQDWGYFEQQPGGIQPTYHAEELAEYIRQCNRVGGMVTVNAQIYQDGRMGAQSLRIMQDTGRMLQENP